MPIAGNTLITQLGIRLRDPTNFAYPRATIANVLTLVQRVVQAHFKLVMSTTTFTVTNFKAPIFRFSDQGINPNSIFSVETISQDQRLLDRVPWRELIHQQPDWITRTGPRCEVWSTIGKGDLYIVVPTPYTAPTLTVTYVVNPTDVTDTATVLTVPDVATQLVRDIAEVILLTTGRRFDSAADPTQRILGLIQSFKQRRKYLDIGGQA
jgi:hypothetical protein